MRKPVRKIGNSQGIILSKEMLDKIGVKIGDQLEATIKNGKILLTPEGK